MRRTLILSALALSACNPGIQFVDDFDFRFDLRRVAGPDALETPYVEGTPVRITLTSARDLDAYDVRSADPEVFRIEQRFITEDAILLECTAAGPGVTELVVTKNSNDRVVETAVIEVGRPDAVELHGAGAVFAMLGDEASLTVEPVLLDGGLATYEVRWFEGNRRLFGNSVLAVGGERAEVEADQTFLFENREWLRIRANQGPGEATVELFHLDRPIDTRRVEVVGPDAVASLTLEGASERDALEGDTITLLGDARDAEGRAIHGAEYDWFVNAVQEWGTGDMYRYTFDPLARNELVASFDGLEAARPISGEGYVDSSNDIGCSSSGALGSWALVALAGLVARTRARELARA